MSKVLYSDPILGQVEQLNIADGFPVISINHLKCQAKVSLYGGHVLSWQPTNQKEVFWLSDTALYQEGKAIRGGIPLCWPWFGPLEGSNQHGFARQVFWQLESIQVSDAGVTVVICWQGDQMDKLWPYRARLEQTLFFGETFHQSLTITNLSDEAFQYTGALHSYFKVSSPDNVTVPLLNNVEFDDKLTGDKITSLVRKNCQGPIDTVYYNNQAQTLIDSGWQREIDIVNTNTREWVLWNPGVETAKNMVDVHQGGEQEYVCLEAANTQWQQVNPNETVTISQTITVKTIK